jgi:hypothetical protein
MDDVKLLPCPFCGELPTITKHFKHEIYSFVHRCSVIGPITRDFREREQDHADMWNTRCASDLDAQRLRADTAEAEVTRLEDEFDTLESTNTTMKLKLAAAEQRIAELLQICRDIQDDPRLWLMVGAEISGRISTALNPKPEAGSHE